MLYKAEYDSNGKKVLCEMNGVNPEMLMDIYVKKLKNGEKLDYIGFSLFFVFSMRVSSYPAFCSLPRVS